MLNKMKLDATWTPDCSGKQDYDAPIVSISTRYWPRGGGFYTFDSNQPERGLQGNETRPEMKPSATTSLIINYGEGDSLDLERAKFEAETEEEVKAAVEAWAQRQMDRVVALLQTEFRF